jgi:hypothetical protein
MRKGFVLFTIAAVAVACFAGSAFAAAGKVVSADGDKVVLEAKGAGLAVGAVDVEVKGAGGVLAGKVTAVAGDKVTFHVTRGKASALKVGESVTITPKAKSAEATQGC